MKKLFDSEEEFQQGLEHAKWAENQSTAYLRFWVILPVFVIGATIGATIYFNFDFGLQISAILSVGFLLICFQNAVNHAANSYGMSLFFDEIGNELRKINHRSHKSKPSS